MFLGQDIILGVDEGRMLIGEKRSVAVAVAVVAVVGGIFCSIFILALSACTCPKERQIDCFRLDPANTSCLNLLQFVHRLMLIFPLHTLVGNELIEVLLFINGS